MKRYVISAVAAAAMMVGTAAHAGAFILAGTDADDHGTQAELNVGDGGWFFMQRALENLRPNVTNTNKVVTILGSTSSALTAATASFTASNLGANGWSLQTIGTGDFANFFGNLGTFAATGAAASGILMMDSGNTNIGGGVDDSSYNTYATQIDSFINGGGGLFSQGNGYSWLTALLPTVGVVDIGGGGTTGVALTATGTAAFPGLTNADLTTGPWHNYFTNVGALNVFASSTAGAQGGAGNPVIIGAVTGSITNPGRLPEPTTVALVGLALLGAAAARRKSA